MRFDRLLAGTALALVLALGTANAQSAPDTPAAAPAAPALDAVPPTEPAPLAVTPADLAPAAAPAAAAPSVTPEPAPLAAGPVPTATPDAVRVEATAVPTPTSEVATPDTAAVPVTAPAPVAVTPVDVAPAADTAPPKAATVTPPAAEQPTGSVPAAVAAPAVPAAPAAAVVSLDQQVGEKLAELLAKKGDRRLDAKTRASLESFYAARANGPVWTSEGTVNARAKAVIAQLGRAEADGMDSDDYPVPTLKADATADEVADYEIKLTQSVLAYAKHAAVGRIHWSRINGDVVYYQNPPEAAEVMGKLVSVKGDDAGTALDGYQPQHAHYKALKAKLAEARGLSSDTSKRIGYGPALKVGMDDARVPELREKLAVAGTGTAYDKTLADAVKAFQKKKGLKQTGVFDAAAVGALNGPRNERTADVIRANLERWRWVPHDLGKAHVIVNIPEFVLRVYKDDATLWTTRVVVGKPGNHATPLLSETMKYITVNPTWNVPPSIVYNEYLPALQQDPTVLSRMGLNVSRRADGSVHISQPPGAGNALGRIRFNFPNKFLVYQHDTPDKHLFAHDRRAYSHGCMRVKDPDKYAEVLLGIALPKEGYSAERIRRMYGTSETNINFPTPIPVHLTYQTASVDETGKLVLREDIYGRDQRLIAAMKSDERKVADQPTAERRVASSTPRRQAVQLPQEQPRSVFPLFNLFR